MLSKCSRQSGNLLQDGLGRVLFCPANHSISQISVADISHAIAMQFSKASFETWVEGWPGKLKIWFQKRACGTSIDCAPCIGTVQNAPFGIADPDTYCQKCCRTVELFVCALQCCNVYAAAQSQSLGCKTEWTVPWHPTTPHWYSWNSFVVQLSHLIRWHLVSDVRM
jgi:hypothetical protein